MGEAFSDLENEEVRESLGGLPGQPGGGAGQETMTATVSDDPEIRERYSWPSGA